jgi:hypothetical protein
MMGKERSVPCQDFETGDFVRLILKESFISRLEC